MTTNRQWLDLGLDALPTPRADRVRLFRLMVATATRMRAALDRELASSGITTQQAALLQCVQAQPEAPTIGAVALAMSMTHQNVKQIVVALQRKGFLDIVVDEADRRARRLVLTKHHHRFWARRNPQDFSAVEGLTADLGDAEVQTLVGLLARLNSPLGGTPLP
jgi:DNA-binding MarR family transcriptional regulator